MLDFLSMKHPVTFDLGGVLTYAIYAHEGQLRDYTGEHYVNHPTAVAKILMQHGANEQDGELEVFGALLHDAVEDSNGKVTLESIMDRFGPIDPVRAAELVEIIRYTTKISKKEDGNRARRIAIDAAHYASGGEKSQNIKVADLLHNLPEMAKHNPEFAKKYLLEKEALLKVLTKAKPSLRKEAEELIERLKIELL